MSPEQWAQLDAELEALKPLILRVSKLAANAESPAKHAAAILLAVGMAVHTQSTVTLRRLAEHAVRLSA